MTPEQLERLLDRLIDVRNTDDLFDLELKLGPFDEEDALTARALFHLAAVRCRLARGPAPSPDTFVLTRPAPAYARERFEVRGRVGTRIVRVGWADGALFGSLYALRRMERAGGRCLDAGGAESGIAAAGPTGDSTVAPFADAATARQRILALFDVVMDELRTLAVA